jgi:hypothetical protein
MGFVSKREHDQERFEEGRALIAQARQHPVRIERAPSPPQPLTLPSLRKPVRVALYEKRLERLADLAARLKFAGMQIRLAGERIRLAQEYGEQLERRRVERNRTPLGRLANRLDMAEARDRIRARALESIRLEANLHCSTVGRKPIVVVPAIFGRLYADGHWSKPRSLRPTVG